MGLDRHEPGDDADERHVGTDAELLAELAAAPPALLEAGEIEAERHDREARGRADAERQQIVADARD